jgi:hypothetical protein
MGKGQSPKGRKKHRREREERFFHDRPKPRKNRERKTEHQKDGSM